MRRFNQKKLIMMFLAFALASTLVAITAQSIRYPTYEYYGQVLSADEFLELVNKDVPLHCVQIPSLESYLSDRAPVDFMCFNTPNEADIYSNEIVPEEWERISQDYSDTQVPPFKLDF